MCPGILVLACRTRPESKYTLSQDMSKFISLAFESAESPVDILPKWTT